MRALAVALLVSPLWACQTQGPFEKAGRNVDESIEDVREVAEDVIEDVREGAEDVRDDVQRRRRK
jgi:hypothetical protein